MTMVSIGASFAGRDSSGAGPFLRALLPFEAHAGRIWPAAASPPSATVPRKKVRRSTEEGSPPDGGSPAGSAGGGAGLVRRGAGAHGVPGHHLVVVEGARG